MLVGSPASGNLAKRVPPRPVPQLGIATVKSDYSALDRVDVDATTAELPSKATVIIDETLPIAAPLRLSI